MGGRGSGSGMSGGTARTVSNEEAMRKLDSLKEIGRVKKGQPRMYAWNPLMERIPVQDLQEINKLRGQYDNALESGAAIKGKPVSVSMDSVVSPQSHVMRSVVSRLIQNPSDHQSSSDMPYGFEHKGKIVLLDGNHRAVTALLTGQKRLNVRIVKYKRKGARR